MLRNYFLITYRSMMKNKLFILTNVFGMAIAIGQCIMAYFAYEYDATFDAIHAQRHQVYRVSALREFDGKFTRHPRVPYPLGEVVEQTFADVGRSSRYHHSYSNFKLEDDLFPSNLHYVDPEFFQLFTFDFVAGGPGGISDPTGAVISEQMAVRLFGGAADGIGKTITQVYGQELKEVKIAGVFRDPPMNSSFHNMEGSAYMNFENVTDEHSSIKEDDWKVESILFVEVADPGRLSAVHQQLQPFTENNNKVREDFQVKEFVLDLFATMAHKDRADDIWGGTWGAPPISAVIGSSVMGILVLLLACFNLTNTAIAISSGRLKEIGIRKVMGSMRKHLIVQFIGETMFICLVALLLGLLSADFMVRGWNYMWQYFQLEPRYIDNPVFLMFLAGVLLFTALVAGSYPALYISRFEPVHILKGKLRFGGTNYFTRVLLALQFCIALLAIVSAVGFTQNARYQRTYDLGFDVRGSVIAWVNDRGEFDTYRNALQSHPDILSIAGARSGIFSNRANDPIKFESRQLEVDIIEVGDNYLTTLQLKLKEGRDFQKDSETDRKESVIITQKLADELGWDKPLGKEIIWRDTVKLYVIGVVRDVYTMGLWREMEPMMIRYVLPGQYGQLVVSARAEDVTEVNTFMKKEWNTIFPNRLYNGRMLNEDLKQVNEVNLNIVYMFAVMGLITMLLSATGLFTLVSLNIIRRMKEIGVRKVLGASVSNIARIVNTEFVVILVLASALGSWAGYVQSDMIMGSIWRYYQRPNSMTFVFSIGVLLLTSFLTIGYKVFKAATMNPVESLKEE